jgi:hypothetical protein
MNIQVQLHNIVKEAHEPFNSCSHSPFRCFNYTISDNFFGFFLVWVPIFVDQSLE